jgi:hypothetical protein
MLVYSFLLVAVFDTIFISTIWKRYQKTQKKIPWIYWISIACATNWIILREPDNLYLCLVTGGCLGAASTLYMSSRFHICAQIVRILWTSVLTYAVATLTRILSPMLEHYTPSVGTICSVIPYCIHN